MLVTSCTTCSGIGKHTAAVLASRGATVLLAGKVLVNNAGVFNEERVLTEVGHICTQQLRRGCQPAGLSRTAPSHATPQLQDGLEETWQVNVAAPFLLTAELLPAITSRIINISSISLADDMDWGNLQGEREYGRVGHQAYALSKLALNMWSYQLAARLHRAHHPAVVHLVDPGTVATKASSRAIVVQVHCAASSSRSGRQLS